eukprot:3402245-Ditylum_brightwellii.AAC.1
MSQSHISKHYAQESSEEGFRKSHGRHCHQKPFLVLNAGVILPVSESGWERVHAMHIAVYGKKNQTV